MVAVESVEGFNLLGGNSIDTTRPFVSVIVVSEAGDSAIFALLDTSDPETVVERFRGYGGTILRTNLDAKQADKIESVLHNATHTAGAR
jgi:uncharacterized membrane protein